MFEKGDLVIHAQGTLFPEGDIQGVIIDRLEENPNFYKVFWYTTGRYQNLDQHCLKPISWIHQKKGKT